MTAIATAPAAKSEPRPRYGVAVTAPAVETVSGALLDEEGRVTGAVEGGAVVVPEVDTMEVLTTDEGAGPEGAGPEGGMAPPEDGRTGGTPAGGTLVCAGGAGGTTVVASDGGPLREAVAVDSTKVTGGAGGGGGASKEGAAGGVWIGTPGVPHTVSVTVTVTGATQVATEHVSLSYTEVIM